MSSVIISSVFKMCLVLFTYVFMNKVTVSRVSDRHGWLVKCNEPLQFMSLHIPEENR